jgi:hypothetical protein
LIQVFREISIGGLSKEQLMRQLVKAEIQFNHYANILFAHPSFVPCEQKVRVKLAQVSFSDLNLSGPCSLEDIVVKASELGLKPCPLYLAAFLRLEYSDQHEGPHLTIASPRPEGDENYPAGFYVRNIENTLWLRGYRASGDCEWPAGNQFVFLAHNGL